jgi:hypothetical protein
MGFFDASPDPNSLQIAKNSLQIPVNQGIPRTLGRRVSDEFTVPGDCLTLIRFQSRSSFGSKAGQMAIWERRLVRPFLRHRVGKVCDKHLRFDNRPN